MQDELDRRSHLERELFAARSELQEMRRFLRTDREAELEAVIREAIDGLEVKLIGKGPSLTVVVPDVGKVRRDLQAAIGD